MNESDMYREWDPPPAWRGIVTCLWEQRVTTDFTHRVVPDGCADVIVGFDASIAVGLADGPVLHRLARGSACRGIRVRPEAVATFFGIGADELRNLEVPLDDVIGTTRARRMVDSVIDSAPNTDLTAQPPEQIARALKALTHVSVEETAANLGMTTRHLRRLVTTHTGLGPKAHQRVIRLRRFLDTDDSLANAAVAAGYADQAHLTREVTRLCGLPPAELRAERAARPASVRNP